MSLDGWISEFRARAVKDGDAPRVRLTRLDNTAFALRETNPEQALALYEEGSRLAKTLDEPWWVLFYDHWRLTAKIHFLRDYREVPDLAVKSLLEIRKPQYDGLGLRTSFGVHLIDAYLGTDPRGYAGAIEQALAHLAEEMDKGGRPSYTLLGSRREFALVFEDYHAAERLTRQSLSMLEDEPDRSTYIHHGTFLYDALSEIAWRRRDWATLAEAAPVAEDLATKVGHKMELAGAKLWRALAAQHAGDGPNAQRLYRQSVAGVTRLRMPPEAKYFDALCDFLEINGNVEGQWSVREHELAAVRDKGRTDAESRCRIKRCRLLARLGRPFGEELAAGREAAGKLKDPAPRLAEMEAIFRGATESPS